MALEAEVAACAPVLPLLSAQLRETIEHVEQSVVEVCGGFQDLVDRARRSVALLTSYLADESDQSSIGALLEATRRTLQDLLDRVEAAAQFSFATSQKLQAIEAGMEEIEANLQRVDKIAQHARLVALNGNIEAARAGEHGAAFGVVAQETGKLAVHAGDTSRLIRNIVRHLHQAAKTTSNELQERAESDLKSAADSRDEVERVLDVLTAANGRMHELVRQSACSGEELAGDISRAVMAMQFQDAVSQRVSHVVGVLDEIERALVARLDPMVTTAAASHDWMERVSRSYVMAAQRDVHATHVGDARDAHGDLGNNVELF